MKEKLEQMKDISIIEPVVTIKSTIKDDTKQGLNELAENMLK